MDGDEYSVHSKLPLMMAKLKPKVKNLFISTFFG
jgi:hypothetical protein